jgi:hypothetical protein
VDKSITLEKLKEKVKTNFDLIPDIINGMSSTKAAIRYGCGKILIELSEEIPDKLYPYLDKFIGFLDSSYRIIIWQAMAIIANLTRVDKDNKFDEIFDKYYSFLDDPYMVTVANLIGHSGKIALAKPNLTNRITNKLLKVENIKTTPHITEECKKVITEKAILSFGLFFDQVEKKNEVISFVKKQLNSSRKTLRTKAENFLKKWDEL